MGPTGRRSIRLNGRLVNRFCLASQRLFRSAFCFPDPRDQQRRFHDVRCEGRQRFLAIVQSVFSLAYRD